MSRWIGIILVVVLYLVFNKQLERNLVGETKTDQIQVSASNKRSFPEVDRKIMDAARPPATVINKLTAKEDKKAQCFSDMFNEIKCDFTCWNISMERQGSQLPQLVLRDWKKQDPRFNINNHTDVYSLYHALNSVGLLTGGDQPAIPQYDKAIDIMTELSLKDPKNYYPYLFLALLHEKKGESADVIKVLRQMDETARYYNNYYSDWMARLESESTESLETFARAISIGSELPIPSLKDLIPLSKKYALNKRKLSEAMVQSTEDSKKAHKYSVLAVSFIDLMLAKRISNDVKLKARKNETFNPGLNRFMETFSSDFPEECERTAVGAWFQKHRSEIQ
jgi:tetratricopeptide (TPR) repeat protein